jgi:SAM-dependent methyltransferase
MTPVCLSLTHRSTPAGVCSVSVEYLSDPLAVFADVWRVLAPGGVLINSFSNRWFPPKTINLWIDLHEFERMGLVGEYYLRTEGFGTLHSWSQRALRRPHEDNYSAQLAWSDPLYGV